MPADKRIKARSRRPYDKYECYHQAVQNPQADVDFMRRIYSRSNQRPPLTLREDFSGSFAISCAWLESSAQSFAHAVDYDPQPLAYGKKNYLSKLSPAQQSRLGIHQKSVLEPGLPTADVICALNFSYFIFRDRDTLRSYFERCRKDLNEGGMLVLDCFGGSECYYPNTTKTDCGGLLYYWDLVSFEPVTHHCVYQIHFKRPGEKKRLRQFVYYWRLWTLPELQELLREAGFSRVEVYWEGVSRGRGNGIFRVTRKGEPDLAWIAYITACR